MTIAYKNIFDTGNEHAFSEHKRFNPNRSTAFFAFEQGFEYLVWFFNKIKWSVKHRVEFQGWLCWLLVFKNHFLRNLIMAVRLIRI